MASFRSLVTVATATALLSIPRGVFADNDLGCVSVSSTFPSMTSVTENSPDSCKTTCSNGGYTYYGVSQQFCACSKTKPTISKTFDASACSFKCASPNQDQTCGGEDSATFQFLYNLYEISESTGGGASSTAPTTTTTATTATTSDSNSIPDNTPTGGSSPTDGTSVTVTGTSAVSGSAIHAAPQSTQTVDSTIVFISTIDCSCTKSHAHSSSIVHGPLTVVTSTVEVVETVSCSGAPTTQPVYTTPQPVYTSKNNNQNGPYSNTTLLTTAKPVSPSVTSYVPTGSALPSAVVTAAGAPAFEQVSLLGKEWYLSLIALTVAFVLL